MKKRKFILAMFMLMLTVLILTSCGKEDQKIVLINMDYSYSYANVRELAKDSDLIASVTFMEVEKVNKDDVVRTVYRAKIDELIYGERESEISLAMIGGVLGETLYIAKDDPLPESGDSFIVFSKQNGDGTYIVLNGQQGRFFRVDEYFYPLRQLPNKEQIERHTYEYYEVASDVDSIELKRIKIDDFIENVKLGTQKK